MLSTPNGTFLGKVLLIEYLSPSAITHKNVRHFCGVRGGREVELGNYPARFRCHYSEAPFREPPTKMLHIFVGPGVRRG